MNDDLYDRLHDRTWRQLKECAYLAMTALAQISAEGADDRAQTRIARETLEKTELVLSPEWESGTPR